MEYDFYLQGIETTDKTLGDQPLPQNEFNRRINVLKTRIFLRLYVNGKYVARTKKQFLKWP
jgi:hypothetical protein